jgi:CRISPR/Cas system-associated exonuclease Cas4 (RecB family)
MARDVLKKLNNIVRDNTLTVPIEIVFLNELNNTIEKINTKPNLTTKTYKPSSLKCIRNMYYQNVGMAEGEFIEAENPDIVGICESGTDRHERIQEYITKMVDVGYDWVYYDVASFLEENGITDLEVKKKVGFETKLFNSFSKYGLLNGMNFQTDGLLKRGDKFYVFEFKTESSQKWYKREGVDESHHDQAIAYSLSFGVSEVIFVYENRDTCQKKAYLFKVSERMKQDLINKLKECDGYVRERKLPPKGDNKRLCYYCKYKEYCKTDQNVESET